MTLLDHSTPAPPPNGSTKPETKIKAHNEVQRVAHLATIRTVDGARADQQASGSPTRWLTWLLVAGYTVSRDDAVALGLKAHSLGNALLAVRKAGYTVTSPTTGSFVARRPGSIPVVSPAAPLPAAPRFASVRVGKTRKASSTSTATDTKARAASVRKLNRVADRRRKVEDAPVEQSPIVRAHPDLGEVLAVRMLIADGDSVIIELRSTADAGRTFLTRLVDHRVE